MKSIVYLTITFDSLLSAGRSVQLNLKPLGTVRFLGLVRGLISQNAEVLHVDVDYTPSWICEYFRLLDCGLGAWKVASVALDTDGRFSAALPNLAQDAVISLFTRPGEFAFWIRDPKTGNPLYELKPAGSKSFPGRVPVADGYPGEYVFDAELPK